MPGHKRYRSGAWRLTVEGPKDPITGERQQLHRTVHAPNTKAGAKLADVELAKLVVEVDSGKALPSSGLTVDQLLERYITSRAHEWSPSEPARARSRAKNHISPVIGAISIERVRPIEITMLYTQLRAKPARRSKPANDPTEADPTDTLGEATVRKVHNLLHAALEWAWRNELIPSNPASKADQPGQGTSKVGAPMDEILIALLTAAGDDMVCYLRVSAVTGARRGQIVALRWRDLDLKAGTVLFTAAHTRAPGGIVEKGTKADIDYGAALDPKTVEILKAHRARAVERALAVGKRLSQSAFVFARSPDGSKAWHPDGANQRFNRVRAKVPGAESVTPHQLRHWMATSMFEDGYDPVTVAGRGGWASPAVPMKVYGHFRPARDQAAAASLAQRLDGQTG